MLIPNHSLQPYLPTSLYMIPVMNILSLFFIKYNDVQDTYNITLNSKSPSH